jgi:hypothetical protein
MVERIGKAKAKKMRPRSASLSSGTPDEDPCGEDTAATRNDLGYRKPEIHAEVTVSDKRNGNQLDPDHNVCHSQGEAEMGNQEWQRVQKPSHQRCQTGDRATDKWMSRVPFSRRYRRVPRRILC